MLVIGIVGPPCVGKSTVSDTLQSLGALHVDADQHAHGVLHQPDVIARLSEYFGTEIIDKDGPGAGKINRRKLGSLVFGETPQCRAGLEMLQSTIHPLTRQSMIRQISAAAAEAAGGDSSVRGQISVILDVPLLFESQWDLACDTIWCITAPLNARQAWAAKRGWTAAHLKDREQKQISTREKQRRSTITIANDSTPAALRSAVLTELRKIVATSTDAFFTL